MSVREVERERIAERPQKISLQSGLDAARRL
jgi:hypothetical protein